MVIRYNSSCFDDKRENWWQDPFRQKYYRDINSIRDRIFGYKEHFGKKKNADIKIHFRFVDSEPDRHDASLTAFVIKGVVDNVKKEDESKIAEAVEEVRKFLIKIGFGLDDDDADFFTGPVTESEDGKLSIGFEGWILGKEPIKKAKKKMKKIMCQMY